ncbi:hypothetical protein D9M68_487000 [compost metagenome]
MGASDHSTKSRGPSTGQALQLASTASTRHTALLRAALRTKGFRRWLDCACAWSAVVHCSRCLRLTTSRQVARKAASSSRRVCAASCTNCQAAPARARSSSTAPASKKWRSSMARRVGTRPASAPSSGPSVSAAPTAASAQPSGMACVKITSTSSAKDAGTTSERRRLSLIFHRPSASIPKRRARHISGSSCQSPRTQRCTREAATPAWCGWSSTSTTSLTIAQRATLPSSRSWLSTALSGRRSFSVACTARTLSKPLPVKEPLPNTSW